MVQMGIFNFFSADPLPQPSSTVFARFPTEVNVNVINCLLQLEPFDVKPLQSLLLAYPPLSELVLLITDHPENPRLLLQVPHVSHVPIHGYHQFPWEQSRRFPIKIMSLAHTDRATTNGELTHFSSCLYSRHLSPEITVLCGVYHNQSIGYETIRRLYKRAGISRFQAIESSSFSDNRRAMQLHSDIQLRQRDCPMFLSMLGPPKSVGNKLVNLLGNKWPYEVESAESLDIQVGDDPKLMDWHYSDTTARLKTVQLRFTKNLRKKHEGDAPVRTSLHHCSLEWIEQLYIEFDTHIVPKLLMTLYYLWKKVEHREFTLVNVNWSPSQPSGSGIENEEVLMPYDEDVRYFFDFTEAFHCLTYVGIPDKVVEGTGWTLVKEFNWWRMSPMNGVERTEDIYYHGRTEHLCERLQRLKIVSTTKEHPVTLSFTLNLLEELTLVSLDNGVWDLDRLLSNNNTMAHLTSVCLVLKGDYDKPSPLRWRDISLVAGTAKELTIAGYYPEFLRKREGYFPNLERLNLDVWPLWKMSSVSEGESEPTPVMEIALYDKVFPVVSAIRLTALNMSHTLLPNSPKAIRLNIPETVDTIECGFEITHSMSLTINGCNIEKQSDMDIPGSFLRLIRDSGSWTFSEHFTEPRAFYEFDL